MWEAASPQSLQAARFRVVDRCLNRVGVDLTDAQLGPCECLVLQVGTGRFPLRIAQVTRRWNETEWDGAVESLRKRG